MLTTLRNLTFLASLACTAQAAVYVDARVSYLDIAGSPSIGDIGTPLESDLSDRAYSFAVGTTLTPRLRLEARFTDLGNSKITKVSPIWAIMPPIPDVYLPAQRYYRYEQSTRLYSLALPVEVWSRQRFSLVLTPLIHAEESRIAIDDLYINVATIQGLLLPQPPLRYLDSTRTRVRLGGEAGFAFRATERVKLTFTYAYANLQAYDAHLFGAGLGWDF